MRVAIIENGCVVLSWPIDPTTDPAPFDTILGNVANNIECHLPINWDAVEEGFESDMHDVDCRCEGRCEG